MKSKLMTMAQEKQDFIKCISYAFKAPFVFATDWGMDFPQSTLEKAKLMRIAELSKIWNTKQCSDFEAMMYFSSLTMVTPVTHEAYKMYLHCFLKYNDISILSQDPQVQEWIRRDSELFDNEKEDLSFLKKRIFSRQMERIK